MTNMATASYHPRILSGQTGNVKPLSANRSLSFPVKWPNLDLKVSIVFGLPVFDAVVVVIVVVNFISTRIEEQRICTNISEK